MLLQVLTLKINAGRHSLLQGVLINSKLCVLLPLVFEGESMFSRYALHFLVQSGLTYGIMILTGVEHMHK